MSSKGSSSGAEAAAAQAASNREAIAETRRQFDITQGQIQPFVEAGVAQLPALEAGATVGGLDEVLGQIFGSQNFQNLRDERTRALEGQLSAGGLTRSGTALQEAANIPTGLGFELEQLLSNRSANLAGTAQAGAVQIGQFGAQSSANIAGLQQATGQAASSGILADQQADAAAVKANQDFLVSAGALFFSDPSLKENVGEIGAVLDLKLYQWDWKPETKGTMIEGCGEIGFMADEVREKYPQHVYDYAGFMLIDYPSLLNELDEKNDQVIIDLDNESEEAQSWLH